MPPQRKGSSDIYIFPGSILPRNGPWSRLDGTFYIIEHTKQLTVCNPRLTATFAGALLELRKICRIA